MKKAMMMIVSLMLIASVSHAYSNKFLTMTTPSGWSVKEMKMPTAGQVVGGTAARSAASRIGNIPATSGGGAAISGAIDAGVGIATDTAAAGVGYGVMQGMMKNVPAFASATFSKDNAQIMLMIVEGQGGAPTAGDGSAGGGGSNCSTIENTKTSWGGRSAKLYTMRCPHGKEWMYTTTVTMTKGGAMYTLMGTIPTKAKDDAEFNRTLKSARNTMLSSTSFK